MAKKDKVGGAAIATSAAVPQAEAAAPATPVGIRGPKGVALTAQITILAAGNPKREGSKAHGRFALYQDGMSVQDALDAGVITPDLVHDAAHGHIAIEGYSPVLVEKKVREPKPAKEPKAKGKKAKAEAPAEAKAAAEDLAAATTEETID